MKKYLAILAAACSLWSCIYPFSPDFGDELDDDTIVIDGTVLIGQESKVAVRKMVPLTQAASSGTTRQDLSLEKGYTVSVRLEDSAGETYPAHYDPYASAHVINTVSASSDRQYRLFVEIARQVYADGTFSTEVRHYETPWLDVMQAPVIDAITFNTDGVWLEVRADAHAEKEGDAYFRFDYEETWEFHPPFEPEFFFDVGSGRILPMPEDWENDVYNCWLSATPREQVLYSTRGLVSPKAEHCRIARFPRGNNRCQEMYSILLKSMALTREAYEYHETLYKNSNQGGSLFETTPSEIRGNITCVEDSTAIVLGYVSATTVKSRRAFMDGRYYMAPNYEFELFHPDYTDMTPLQYYAMGYRPVKEWTIVTGDIRQTALAWAQRRCIDCVADGGSKIKPAYWPNDHR